MRTYDPPTLVQHDTININLLNNRQSPPVDYPSNINTTIPPLTTHFTNEHKPQFNSMNTTRIASDPYSPNIPRIVSEPYSSNKRKHPSSSEERLSDVDTSNNKRQTNSEILMNYNNNKNKRPENNDTSMIVRTKRDSSDVHSGSSHKEEIGTYSLISGYTATDNDNDHDYKPNTNSKNKPNNKTSVSQDVTTIMGAMKSEENEPHISEYDESYGSIVGQDNNGDDDDSSFSDCNDKHEQKKDDDDNEWSSSSNEVKQNNDDVYSIDGVSEQHSIGDELISLPTPWILPPQPLVFIPQQIVNDIVVVPQPPINNCVLPPLPKFIDSFHNDPQLSLAKKKNNKLIEDETDDEDDSSNVGNKPVVHYDERTFSVDEGFSKMPEICVSGLNNRIDNGDAPNIPEDTIKPETNVINGGENNYISKSVSCGIIVSRGSKIIGSKSSNVASSNNCIIVGGDNNTIVSSSDIKLINCSNVIVIGKKGETIEGKSNISFLNDTMCDSIRVQQSRYVKKNIITINDDISLNDEDIVLVDSMRSMKRTAAANVSSGNVANTSILATINNNNSILVILPDDPENGREITIKDISGIHSQLGSKKLDICIRSNLHRIEHYRGSEMSNNSGEAFIMKGYRSSLTLFFASISSNNGQKVKLWFIKNFNKGTAGVTRTSLITNPSNEKGSIPIIRRIRKDRHDVTALGNGITSIKRDIGLVTETSINNLPFYIAN